MLEAWRFCESASVMKMRPRLRSASDGAESRARRDHRERLVGADRVTAELRVGDDERGATVRRERAVHRLERVVELILPLP